MAKAPTVVVAGAGLMGRWHADAARRTGATVVAIIDVNTDRAARLARQYSAIAVATLTDLPASLTVDVVHVCTPAATHHATIIASLARGAHVICEKPLGANLAEVRDCLAAARSAQKHLWPVHQYPYQRGTQRLLGNLTKLGSLQRVQFSFCTAGAQLDPGLDPATLALDILPHPFSVLAAAHLNPAGAHWQVTRTRPGELSLSGAIDQVAISIDISTSARPTEAQAVFYGSAATARLDFYHGFVTWRRGRPGRTDKLLRPFVDALQSSSAAATNLAWRLWNREFAYPGLSDLFRSCYTRLTGTSIAPDDDDTTIAIYSAVDQVRTQ